jgi:transcriptional regulator of heat shock response
MSNSDRQYALLQAVIEEYVGTAKPVSSKTLVTEYGFDVSPATIRNDLSSLEEAGLIVQPHTSAGRIPTEKGYQFYIEHFIKRKSLAARHRKTLAQADAKGDDSHRRMKTLARAMSDLTNEAVVVSHGKDSFVSGLSKITRKPDFVERSELVALSEMFDQLDEVMNDVQDKIDREVQILVGANNPIARSCSIVITQYELPDRSIGVMGILGPMRMDYETNVAVIEYVDELIEDE